MQKQPSMLNLKHRREQQFQGVRMVKPARIVNKGGDRNVESIHIPEKSAKFFKDFVHTLVKTIKITQVIHKDKDRSDDRFICRLKHNGDGCC